jgi:hypothetical protein
VQHSTSVLTLARRLASLVAILALCAGNMAVCAGWEATPEARMACCPDGCCATPDDHQSGTPASAFVPSPTLAPAVGPLATMLPMFRSALEGWRALVPLPHSPVPKHLLLAVFLV